jgi:tripartite-type tricarboxylate transporter receptor subunit TctC
MNRFIYWLISVLLSVMTNCVQAQVAYPTREVKLIAGFAAGGATDTIARYYAKKLTDKLGQTFIVENRPGGGGIVSLNALAQSLPDGYILALGSNPIASNAVLNRNPYDWRRDLAPIAMLVSTPNVLVVPGSSPINSVKELVEAAKKTPGTLTFASAGTGSTQHLAGELFQYMANVKMTHVPYRGGSQALIDMLAARVDLTFGSSATMMPLVESKKLKLLAITGPYRLKQHPDVPTIAESGYPGFDVQGDYFMVAPANIPQSIQMILAKAVDEISRQPDTIAFIESMHARPLYGGPAETKAFIEGEYKKWKTLIDAVGIKVD